jgi:hypothetical protein
MEVFWQVGLIMGFQRVFEALCLTMLVLGSRRLEFSA